MDVNLPSEMGTLSGEVSAVTVTTSSVKVLSHLRETIPAWHPSPSRRIQSLQICSGTAHVGKVPGGSLNRRDCVSASGCK